MLHEERTDVSGHTPEELLAEYHEELAGIVGTEGIDAVAEETGVDSTVLDALAAGETPSIDLADAAAIQALSPEAPDAEAVHVEATEHLLLGMSMAVLDVDAVAANVELALSPKEIQQKLERRAPMTLSEFASLEHYITAQRQSR
jgi:hypothetical protein